MKKFRIELLFLFLLVLLSSLGGLFWWRWATSPADPQSQKEVLFVIPKGWPLPKIAESLYQKGLVRSALAFKLIVLGDQLTTKIQAGDFRLRSSLTPKEIADFLTHGRLDVWLTLLEGWRSEQIVDALKRQGFFSEFEREELYALFSQYEGRLFPDTYLIPKQANQQEVLSILVQTFEKKTQELGRLELKDLIFASLIEREAKHDADRRLIASVLKNRLKLGMALQVDATLQYARDNAKCNRGEKVKCSWWEPVTAQDKIIDSPYNTYKHPGLPPSPIANPGLASLQAALHPDTTNYLYYVSEPDGTTHFAETLGEHNLNVATYIR